MELILKAGDSVKIPENCTVIERDGMAFFEPVKPEFNKGDFVHSVVTTTAAVKHEYLSIYGNSTDYLFCVNRIGTRAKYMIWKTEIIDRLATKQERKVIIDALAKEGKQWNAEKLCIEPLKYVPKVGDCISFGGGFGEVLSIEDISECIDEVDYEYKINLGHWKPSNKNSSISKNTTNIWFDKDAEIKKITTEEFQSKFKELGYEYNFDTHTARKLKWTPKKGEDYIYISDLFTITHIKNNNSPIDIIRVKGGNCFKLSDRKSAEKFLSYIKAYKHEYH
jgi:hypothetical protein